MKKSRRLIDSHQHAFWHDRDDRATVEDLDDYGIEYAWLLTWETHPTEHLNDPNYAKVLNPCAVTEDGLFKGVPLEDVVMAKRSFPDRFVVGFCPHPLIGNAAARLSSAAAMYDVRVCGEWKFRVPFDDPRCLEIFKVAGELEMPVVLHLDVPYLPDGRGGYVYQPLWYGGSVENLERALKACPETIFIGHAPGFWREISGDSDEQQSAYPMGPLVLPGRLQSLLRKYDNLMADLSAQSATVALKRNPAYAKEFLCEFADKLLFARDYYGGSLLSFLDSLDLDLETWEKIGFQNAENLVAPPTTDERTGKRRPLTDF